MYIGGFWLLKPRGFQFSKGMKETLREALMATLEYEGARLQAKVVAVFKKESEASVRTGNGRLKRIEARHVRIALAALEREA